MTPLRRTANLLRAAVAVTPTRPAYAAGMRASVATIGPLAAAFVFGDPAAGTWMSLGGFNGALSDRGGSYSSRAGIMITLLVSSATALLLGTIGGANFAASLVLTFVVAFVASLLRVWGNPGISIGSATLSVFVVALALPDAHPSAALARVGWLAVGAAWAMAVALVLWPLRPYRPARLAVAACYSALAEYVRRIGEGAGLQQTGEWPIATPGVSTGMRTALENARGVLVQLRRGRPGSASRGERLLVLEESADQLFGHVVAVSETLTSMRGASRDDSLHRLCVSILAQIATMSAAMSVAIETESNGTPVAVEFDGSTLRAAMRASGRHSDPHYEQVAVILDRVTQFASTAAITVEALNGATRTGTTGAFRIAREVAAEDDAPLGDWLLPARAILSPGSLLLRFALRVAVVATIAVALTHLFGLKRGYWVTLTVIVILQPYTGVTLNRAIQRVAGTVLGGLLAAALGSWFHDPRAILVIAAVFVVFCVALLPVNYAAFSVFLTPTFVLLAEASAGDWHLASTRVLNTLLGGALALLGSRLLWPSPERTRFPAFAVPAIRGNAEYLASVLRGYDDTGHRAGEEMRAARRAVGLAAVNAEESLQRAFNEEGGDTNALAPALAIVTYTRRITASAAALALSRHNPGAPAEPVLHPVVTIIVDALRDLALSLEERRAPAALPELGQNEELAALPPLARARVERLARQVRTLHDATARLIEGWAGKPAA